jgi:GAF domain-containing protein
MVPGPAFAASEAVASTLGMASIGISLCTQPMYASDLLAERVEDRQFVLGEGPSVEAFVGRCPFEATATSERTRYGWLTLDLDGEGIGAAFGFPMVVDDVCLGAVTLYRAEPGGLSVGQRALATMAADAAALETASHLLAAREAPHSVTALSRIDALHQAVDIVKEQLAVTAEEAIIRIRAHAYHTDRAAADVVDDLRHGRLRMGDDRVHHGDTGR